MSNRSEQRRRWVGATVCVWSIVFMGCAQVIDPNVTAASSAAMPAPVAPSDAGAAPADADPSEAWVPSTTASVAGIACAPCLYDFECGPGGACMVTDAARAPGVRNCATACSARGAACGTGDLAGTCVDGAGGTLVCVPTAGCARSERGIACDAGHECVGRYGFCAVTSAATSAMCLSACTRDSDCETGFSHCGEGVMPDGSVRAVCLPDAPAGPQGCTGDDAMADTAFHRALHEAGISVCSLGFDRDALAMFPAEIAQNRYRLPAFDRLQRDWMAGARFARATGPALDARANSLAEMITAAAGLRDAGDASALTAGHPVVANASDAPLVFELARLIESHGARADRDDLATRARSVPLDLQRAVAAVVHAIADTTRARDAGLLGARTPAEIHALYVAAPHMLLGAYAPSLSPSRPLELGAMLGDVVLPVQSASALAATVESIDWSAFRGRRGVHFRATTPVGDVVIGDGGNDTYSAAEYPETALLLDLGGDDTYTAPVAANASATNSVSVLIDLGGDDTYGYDEHPVGLDAGGFLPSDGAGRYGGDGGAFSLSDTNRQGAGRLGVGMLFDLGGGDDQYRSLRGSQGFGALGIGALLDDGGNDTYALEAGGQGAGMFGLGILLDRGGNDSYTTWYASQGFGWVRGAGVLYDTTGSDQFVARETPVAYPAAQNPGSNASASQGFGFGRNGQGYADGVDMFGGIGVLRDAAGADTYACGVFGQGAGYLGGMGLLLDRAGNDEYDGRWYVQGAAAHHAYGALVDGDGRDEHHAAGSGDNAAGGAAHDFSLAFLLADGRDGDTYDMPNLSLGAGNANGAGFFADEGGNDVYRTDSTLSCGNAAVDDGGDSARRARATVGVFVDADGHDRYEIRGAAEGSGGAGNDARWSQRQDPQVSTEEGAGCDAEGISVGL